MGAYICTISERDWDIARSRGVYGNRYKKEGENRVLADNPQLSIIRDLVSIKEGDIIFFHLRRKKTIHGIYRARSEAFWEENEIWNDDYDVFPYRFLFEPHPDYKEFCLNDAHISVASLYELIDRGELKSLVTLEFERNIEARAVKRIFEEDARKIIRLYYRDFKFRGGNKASFDLYKPKNITHLKDKIYEVGRFENSIKAVLSWMLAHKDNAVTKIVGTNYEFANEFFVAPTTRKNIDLFCEGSDSYSVIEVKKDTCNKDTLIQALYYADLLNQRPWIKGALKKDVILVGKSFTQDVIDFAEIINNTIKVNNKVKLVKYVPNGKRNWATLEEISNVQRTLF